MKQMSSLTNMKFRKVGLLAIAFFLTFNIGYSQSKKNKKAKVQFDVVILNGRVMDPETGFDQVANVGINTGFVTMSLLPGLSIITHMPRNLTGTSSTFGTVLPPRLILRWVPSPLMISMNSGKEKLLLIMEPT